MNKKDKIGNFKFSNDLNMEKLIKEYSNYLFTVIKNSCGDQLCSEDIEEIILDVFIATWKNQRRLDEERDIKPYLSSIAHHLTKKKVARLRQNITFVAMEEVIYDSANIMERIEYEEEIEKIDKIIETLSKEEYDIFSKFYYQSKKGKEIARELGISEAKVKTRLHRIRSKIKKQLKESGGYSR